MLSMMVSFNIHKLSKFLLPYVLKPKTDSLLYQRCSNIKICFVSGTGINIGTGLLA